MRQAFGQVFMIELILIILFVVVAFATIGLVVGKGYRVKNNLINYIERYEGCESSGYNVDNEQLSKCTLRGTKEDLIKNYLETVGYSEDDYYVVRYKSQSEACNNCYYYQVVLNVDWFLPFISEKNGVTGAKGSNGSSGTFTITGKTDLIRE